jgi:hypothetical protein
VRGKLSSPWDLESDEGGDTPGDGVADARSGEKVGA